MPAGLGGIFGGFAVLFAIIMAIVTIVPVALAYVALRVRDSRDAEPDPKLGLKTAFHTIHTTAILMILGGATVFMVDLMEGAIGPKPNMFGPPAGFGQAKGDGLNSAQRTAFALIGSGLLFSVCFWALLMGTNDNSRRSVRRVFGGGRMALCLLITMFTLTGLLVNIVQKNAQSDITESLIGMLLVWLPAAIIHMILFYRATSETRSSRHTGDDEERGWKPTYS